MTDITKNETEEQFQKLIASGAIKTNIDGGTLEDDAKDLAQQIETVNKGEDSDAPSSHTEERSASVNEKSNATNAGEQGGDTDS
jgi:hypothetical protein